jgi:hypothetical protein
MLRSLSITILLLIGAALLIGLLALRLAASMLYALSGIRRRGACEQMLGW